MDKEEHIIIQYFSNELISCIKSNNLLNSDILSINRILSKSYLHQQNFDKAIFYGNESINSSKTIEDSIIHFNHLSDVYRLKGEFHKSQENILNASKLCKIHNDPTLKFSMLLETLKLSIERKDSVSQFENLEQLNQLSANIIDSLYLGQFYYHKSRVLYLNETIFKTRKEKVLDLLLKAKIIFENINHENHLYNVLDMISIIHLSITPDNYKISESYHLKSILLKEKIGNQRSIAIGHNNYCNFLTEQYLDMEAIEYCKKSTAIAEKINAYDILETSYFNLSYLYRENELYKDATDYLLKLGEIKDTIVKHQNEKELLKIRTEYRTKEKEQENELLKKENELINLGMWFAIATAIFLFIISSLISYLYYQKNKLNKIITFQNEELEKLNSFKNQLFSIMGHDLRGMMSKLNISQRRILRTNRKEGKKSLEKPISKMGAIIDGLNGFIENILYWGFTQTDKLYFNFEALNVNQVIDQVVLNFKYDLENKKLNIIKNIPYDFTIQADANTTKVVIRNLLANAIKYSEENTSISIEANEDKSNHFIKIIDQGIGIPEEIIPILFETKNKKITQGTDGEKGTGLGLWLCKDMMEKNQGKISVKSELAKGTCFILQFPKKNLS